MYSVETPSYYLLAASTVLIHVAALGVVAYDYTLNASAGALAGIVLGAFGTLWGIAAVAVVAYAASQRSSKLFGTASVLVLLTAIVSLASAIAAGLSTGGVYQAVSTSLFTVLVVMYLVLSFVVSEAMIQALRGRSAPQVAVSVASLLPTPPPRSPRRKTKNKKQPC